VRINNVIDLPDPVPEEDDDSYNCMNVDFDRYVVAGIFSQDALDKVAEEEELVFPGSKVRVLGPAARKLAQMVIHTHASDTCAASERERRDGGGCRARCQRGATVEKASVEGVGENAERCRLARSAAAAAVHECESSS
jgi:hypothetical protein